jgi:hypothetical protein
LELVALPFHLAQAATTEWLLCLPRSQQLVAVDQAEQTQIKTVVLVVLVEAAVSNLQFMELVAQVLLIKVLLVLRVELHRTVLVVEVALVKLVIQTPMAETAYKQTLPAHLHTMAVVAELAEEPVELQV